MENGSSTPPISPAPNTSPVPPVPSAPAPAYIPPPVVSPVIFEPRFPQKMQKARRPMSVMSWIGIAFVVAIIVIAALYFWGAQIAARPA